MSERIALDIGTCRTRVADGRGRLLLDEPTAAAVSARDGRIVSFGEKALAVPSRSAGDLIFVRPVQHGQLQELHLVDQVCRHLLGRLSPMVGRHPEVLCAVPSLASGVQRRAVERALKDGGASKVGFVENAVAAAIGLGLGIGAAAASMVVDVGGGATDAGVLSLGGLVNEVSKPAGGTDIDKAIGELCIRSFDLVVSPATAEGVKMAIGTAWPETEAKVEVTGRDSSSGKARTVVVSASEVHAAIAGVVDEIISAAVQVVVTAPPDLANDLLACGLNLTGGAAELHGLARRLAEETGIPVHSSAEGGLAVVRGAARCLPEDKLFEASPKRRPARLSARPGGDR